MDYSGLVDVVNSGVELIGNVSFDNYGVSKKGGEPSFLMNVFAQNIVGGFFGLLSGFPVYLSLPKVSIKSINEYQLKHSAIAAGILCFAVAISHGDVDPLLG